VLPKVGADTLTRSQQKSVCSRSTGRGSERRILHRRSRAQEWTGAWQHLAFSTSVQIRTRATQLKAALTRTQYPKRNPAHALGVLRADQRGIFSQEIKSPGVDWFKATPRGLLNSCSNPDASDATEGARAAEGGADAYTRSQRNPASRSTESGSERGILHRK
jgi:hypothetical protein